MKISFALILVLMALGATAAEKSDSVSCADSAVCKVDKPDGKGKAQLPCESYHYGDCPKNCERECVSSACSNGVCTPDCNGPGSCQTIRK